MVTLSRPYKKHTQKIISLHNEGKSVPDISRLTGVSKTSLYALLSWHSVKPNKYKVIPRFNENYFSKIDTNRKAYFLGLMYADGYIIINPKTRTYAFGINLAEEDSYLLDIFKSELDLKSNVMFKKRAKDNWKDQRYIRINNKKAVDDLIGHGCGQRKSLTLTFPDHINDRYMGSFIRGYLDGDGCTAPQRKGTWVAPKIYFASSICFINGLDAYLKKRLGIIGCTERRQNDFAILIFGKLESVKKLMKLMYENDDVSLLRKKKNLFDYAKV